MTSPDETPGAPSVENVEVQVGAVDSAFTSLPVDPQSADSTPPPLQVSPETSGRWGCLHDLLLVFFSVVLGAGLALIILLGMNGTLRLNEQDKVSYLDVNAAALQTRVDQLATQSARQQSAQATTEAAVQEMETQLHGLAQLSQQQARELAALQARADEIGQAAESVRQQLTALQQDVDTLQTQVDDIQVSIADFRQAAVRFDRLVAGWVALANDLATPSPSVPIATATPGAPAPTITTTAVITATPTITATVATTPVLTPTLPVSPTATMVPSTLLQRFPPRRPLPTPAPGRSILYGLAWLDANHNGLADDDESVLPGVRVVLQDAGAAPLLTMVTGVDGRFAFLNLMPGAYRLQAYPPVDRALSPTQSRRITLQPDVRVEVNFGFAEEKWESSPPLNLQLPRR